MHQDRRTAFHRPATRRAPRFNARLWLEPLEVRANPSHTFTVDDDGAQTNHKADFTSIQAAVNAASPGDRIRVYAGTYHEQVVIPANKDNLVITAVGSNSGGSQGKGNGEGNGKGNGHHDDDDDHGGKGFHSNVIIAPTVFTDPTEAVVHVAGADNVQIDGFTITGASAPTGNGAGANYGVLVDMGGSAKITDNHITAIRDIPLSGVQEGIGVQFGLTNGKGGILSTGSGTVEGNLIDDYQKGGVVVIGSGSNATVSRNTITGAGPTGVIAQNGVQVSNGATAVVEKNTISRNRFTGGNVFAEGILVYQTKGVTVRDNTVFFNNEGILLYQSDNNTVDGNDSRNNDFNGVALFQAKNNVVTHNTTSNNGQDGINIDTSQNNRVEDNFAYFNGRYGIALEATSTGNTVRNNHLGNNQFGDIFVGNPNNTVTNNHTQHDGQGGHGGHHEDPDPHH